MSFYSSWFQSQGILKPLRIFFAAPIADARKGNRTRSPVMWTPPRLSLQVLGSVGCGVRPCRRDPRRRSVGEPRVGPMAVDVHVLGDLPPRLVDRLPLPIAGARQCLAVSITLPPQGDRERPGGTGWTYRAARLCRTNGQRVRPNWGGSALEAAGARRQGCCTYAGAPRPAGGG